ncbi:MAG: antitoxin [Nitriliruptorales bacterium]
MWYAARMKTTLELPDDLMREVKLRAVNEDRRIKDVVADALRRGLALDDAGQGAVRRRVELPIIETAHHARPDEEMTPERVASLLLAEDAGAGAEPRR